MTGKHVVLPGGTGYLGENLRRLLMQRGDRVTVLTRGPSSVGDGWESVHWDGRTVGPWSEVLESADAIIHLSGKRVDCRPTRRNIDELIRSRVEPVRAVGEALKSCTDRPPVWVQLSSFAGFGDRGEAIVDDGTPPPTVGPRQMVEVCRRWEAAFASASEGVPRPVLLRPSIVIGPGDPATRRLATLARFGLGGSIASGKQWVSWIALEDCMSILLRATDSPRMNGSYLVTSPNPIRNEEMMSDYRQAVRRQIGIPSPAFITKLGAWLLGSDPALALTGRRGVPTRLLNDGYEFQISSFSDALKHAI